VFVTVSPPDAAGTVSLGTHVWGIRTSIRNARVVAAEVNENFVRTPGDNSLPMEEIDFLIVPDVAPPLMPMAPAAAAEDQERANAVAANAASLIQDGDTLQFGFGIISAAVASALKDRKDLGLHTENLFPGVLDLIRGGVMTGKRKTFDTGKHVAAGMFLNPGRGDYEFVNGHPDFDIRESQYTNDPKIIS